MNYPKSPDKKIQKLSNVLVRAAESEGLEFSFSDQEIYSVETFSDFGALSLFLMEAKDNYEKVYNKLYTIEDLMEPFGKKVTLTTEQKLQEQDYMSKQIMNRPFPISFVTKEEDTYFGFVPRISDMTNSDFVTLVHFAHYTLEEYVSVYKKNKMLLIEGKIPLDPLYDKMVKKINAKEVSIINEVELQVKIAATPKDKVPATDNK